MSVYNLAELLLSSARKGRRGVVPLLHTRHSQCCSKTDVRSGRRTSSLPAVIKFFPTSQSEPSFLAQVLRTLPAAMVCETLSIAAWKTMEDEQLALICHACFWKYLWNWNCLAAVMYVHMYMMNMESVHWPCPCISVVHFIELPSFELIPLAPDLISYPLINMWSALFRLCSRSADNSLTMV